MVHLLRIVRSSTPGRARRPAARPHVAHESKVRALGVLKEYSRGAQGVLEDTQMGLHEYSQSCVGVVPWAAVLGSLADVIPLNLRGIATEPSRA